VSTYICQHTSKHTCVCMYIGICVHIYANTHLNTHAYACMPRHCTFLLSEESSYSSNPGIMHVRTYVRMSLVLMCACMYVCLYVCSLVCMYVAPSLRLAFIQRKFVRQQFKIVFDNFALQVWKRVVQGHLREGKKKKYPKWVYVPSSRDMCITIVFSSYGYVFSKITRGKHWANI